VSFLKTDQITNGSQSEPTAKSSKQRDTKRADSYPPEADQNDAGDRRFFSNKQQKEAKNVQMQLVIELKGRL